MMAVALQDTENSSKRMMLVERTAVIQSSYVCTAPRHREVECEPSRRPDSRKGKR